MIRRTINGAYFSKICFGWEEEIIDVVGRSKSIHFV